MENQANSFECKECREVFSEESGAYEDFVCDNCVEHLQAEIDSYPNVDSLVAEIDDHLIAELADSNNLHEIPKEHLEKVKKAMRKYAEEEFEEEKDHFLECGHTDESYVEFFFYPFFNQDNFDLEEIVKNN